MSDAWTQTMDPNAWICLHCGVRRIDGDFPDYVCKRAWNGVCEPRVLTPLDPEYEGPYKVKARRLEPVGSDEVVVSRTDLELVLEALTDVVGISENARFAEERLWSFVLNKSNKSKE